MVDEFVPVCLPVERVWKMSIGVLDGTVSPLPSVHSAVTGEAVSVDTMASVQFIAVPAIHYRMQLF